MPSPRPYVICRMFPSVDGRIVLRDWNVPNATREYEKTAATFGADAWIVGALSGRAAWVVGWCGMRGTVTLAGSLAVVAGRGLDAVDVSLDCGSRAAALPCGGIAAAIESGGWRRRSPELR